MDDLQSLNALDEKSFGGLLSLLQPGGLDIWPFIAGCIFGLIGFYAFLNGKKHASGRRMIIGIVLMIYPYFVSGIIWTCLVGLALTAALYFWRD